MPGLVAFYWDGGSPAPHPVREISLTGMYVLTEERWYVGTVVSMRLQQTDTADKDANHSIAVHARAIRWGDDGVGMAFLPPGQNPYQNGHDAQNSERGAKSMKKFINET